MAVVTKIDFVGREHEPFDESEFSRRSSIVVGATGQSLFVKMVYSFDDAKSSSCPVKLALTPPLRLVRRPQVLSSAAEPAPSPELPQASRLQDTAATRTDRPA